MHVFKLVSFLKNMFKIFMKNIFLLFAKLLKSMLRLLCMQVLKKYILPNRVIFSFDDNNKR